jgi:hypothetical protein
MNYKLLSMLSSIDDKSYPDSPVAFEFSVLGRLREILESKEVPLWSNVVFTLLKSEVNQHELMSVRGNCFNSNKTGIVLLNGMRLLLEKHQLSHIPLIDISELSNFVLGTPVGETYIAIVNRYSHFFVVLSCKETDTSPFKYAIVDSRADVEFDMVVNNAILFHSTTVRQSDFYPVCASFAIADCKEILSMISEGQLNTLDNLFSDVQSPKKQRRFEGSGSTLFPAYCSRLQQYSMLRRDFSSPSDDSDDVLHSPKPHLRKRNDSDEDNIPGKILVDHLTNIIFLVEHSQQLSLL